MHSRTFATTVAACLVAVGLRYGQNIPFYRVPCTVYKITQPSQYTCWAATTAMLLNWKSQQNKSIAAALDPYEGGVWRVKFEAGDGITDDQEKKFLAAVGLQAEWPSNPTIAGWYAMLKKHGPLIVTTKEGTNPTSQWVHARFLIEMSGDGTPAGTDLTFVDPADGQEHSESFHDFIKKYEAGSAYDIQIVHLPGTVAKPCAE